MKFAFTLILVFISWWGFIAFLYIVLNNILPDKWYIAIPLFLASWGWFFLFRWFAEMYRNKYN